MPRKRSPDLPGLEQCNVRMPKVQLDRLDAIVDERNRAAGYDKTNRTLLIREAVEDWLVRQPAPAAPVEPSPSEVPGERFRAPNPEDEGHPTPAKKGGARGR